MPEKTGDADLGDALKHLKVLAARKLGYSLDNPEMRERIADIAECFLFASAVIDDLVTGIIQRNHADEPSTRELFEDERSAYKVSMFCVMHMRECSGRCDKCRTTIALIALELEYWLNHGSPSPALDSLRD